MVDESSSYRNYARGIKRMLFFAGLWPTREWACSAYQVLCFFNTLGCFAVSCAAFNFGRENYHNLELLTESIGVTGSYLSTVLKAVCFRINYRELVDLHCTLGEYFEESLSNAKIRNEIFDQLNIYTKSFYVLTVLLFVTCLLVLVVPVIVICILLSKGVYPLIYLLPYSGKYPWSFEGGSFVYYLHYFWQILAVFYLYVVTMGVDSLFGYYVFQIRAIFQLMAHRMRSIGCPGEDNRKIVRMCVETHRVLAKCCNQVEMIYGPIVLWIFITSAIIMCTVIFRISQAEHLTVAQMVYFFAYMAVKLFQAFMYAWYGGVIITESEEYRNVVYDCDWPGSGDKSLMNDVLIMMCVQPMKLTACKFLIISTDMFAAIVNTTMSYFFLLRTLDG
ncbi:odorant receptor 13a-like [Venturia canescens]|uniref:odorant receptor 13a-like n=1 Tax=Venturia canescens TaxID=32260 RepID=UPI001C9C7D60|nr:odorant receptor 13a-like [Venturia canescens]